MNRLAILAAVVLSASTLSTRVQAQVSVPPGQVAPFRDTSMLKVPAGAKVAIYEFEDLECPACARDSQLIRDAVKKYKIPYLHHDFPLPGHRWSRDAAITARYLQDKVSPETAEKFRLDVFRAQQSIASKDDLNNYTQKWFKANNLQMPFVMDPNGLFVAEVNADYTLGQRLNVQETPTILILTPRGYIQVKDISLLYTTLDTAIADANQKPAVAAKGTAKKPVTAQR